MLSVEVTPRAAAQLERAARWWSENRAAAPNAIAEDFGEPTNLLAQQPGVGAPDKVIVLAFWHSNRGTGPKL